jgi:release factor glutamine methyltransferase
VSVRETLTAAAARLRAAGVESADAEARLLLAHVCGRSPGTVALLADPDEGQLSAFEQLVEQRARRVPLQHLTGRAYFRHTELEVGPGVFVPRPETEVMTGWVVDRLRELVARGSRPVVVDLCSGSGAVARSVATEVAGIRVHAVEVSEAAAAWAARNLAGTDVELHVEDMAVALHALDGTVDVVVANPPYIPLEAYGSVAPEARDHDPTVALFSGADGLDAIRTVVATAARLLRPGGLLAFEHAEVQHESAPAVVVASGAFDRVRDHPDLAGRPRFVTAARRGPARS